VHVRIVRKWLDLWPPGEKANVIPEREIQDMVDRETAAWDRQDAEALVELADCQARRSDIVEAPTRWRACS
jgi:hypothetical protein